MSLHLLIQNVSHEFHDLFVLFLEMKKQGGFLLQGQILCRDCNPADVMAVSIRVRADATDFPPCEGRTMITVTAS